MLKKKQSRKARKARKKIEAARDYREKLHTESPEILQPGCMSHTAAALKHHYYPKKMVNSLLFIANELNKTVKNIRKHSSKKKTKIHPKRVHHKRGGYHCMTMKLPKHKKGKNKKRKYKKGKHKTYKRKNKKEKNKKY